MLLTMSSHRGQSSHGHRVRYVPEFGGYYLMYWTVPQQVGRLRYPRGCRRQTDRAGAERFAKKWGVSIEGARA